VVPQPDSDELLDNWGKSDTPSAHMSCLLGDFRALFNELYPRLVIVLRRRTGDPRLAEDIAQETFLIVLQQWQRVCEADQPAAYVTKIAYRVLSKIKFPDPCVPPESLPEPPVTAGMEDQVVTRIMLDWALGQLPQRQFDVMIRYYLMDQDSKTIARELGITLTSVRAHRFKAKAQLRALLKPLKDSTTERNRR
jgi:RNA polymerase sigma factor (sigma-70 family)